MKNPWALQFGSVALPLLAGFACVAAACFFGPADIGPGEALLALFGVGEPSSLAIVRDVRLPRALAAWLVGAALGASGAAMQGLLRNPLADPGVLGVSSAAALGAVIAIYFNTSAAPGSILIASSSVCAVLGALAATGGLVFLARARLSTTRLVLIGIGFSSFAGAMIALVMNLAPNPFVLSDLVNWLFGSVANRSFDDLVFAAPLIAAGGAMLVAAAPAWRALTIGEEAATSLGVDLGKLRALTIGAAALMTGASVALAGAIGFVGIVAPHLARPLVGHDPARVALPAALIGGAMLAAADLALRSLPFDQELKLGVAAALIGAPFFVLIAARSGEVLR